MNNDWWDYLRHSSKGSTWSSHKYIKKVGDKYVYADDQNGSEKASSSSARDSKTSNTKDKKSSSSEGFALDQMANKVIRGEFGNGQERKKLLGDSYKEIQKRVNEIFRSNSKKTAVSKKQVKRGSKQVKKMLNNKK